MMESVLSRLNWLYNQALENRKTAYEQRQQSLSFYDQCQWLTPLRAANEHGLGEIAVGASRGMLKRLDHAFQSFIRRVQAGEAPGFPRFRPLSRCVTIDAAGPRNGMVRLHNGYYLIRVKGFALIRAYSSRSLPLEAPLKSVRLTKRDWKREASLVDEVEREALAASVSCVGIDMGIRKRKLQRALSRCQKGSRQRGKRKAALAGLARKESSGNGTSVTGQRPRSSASTD